MKKVASISISGEMTLNLHSLNNEGGEGNQTMTRQLTIIDKNGVEATVNGISGDMFKHIHAGHMLNYAKDHQLSLCEGCSFADPNRIGIDTKFISILKGIDSEQFEDDDKIKYDQLNDELDTLEESSKEYNDALKRIKEIEKKYLALKITEVNDKNEYHKLTELLYNKLNKKDFKGQEKEFENKKKEQDEAKKRKKEIERKYNLDFSNEEKIDKLLETCIIDDAHGILVTAEKNNLPRKSTIEFGWTVGIPKKNNTETYLHTKLVADAGEKGSATGSNEGQNIFHRPANHGAYAFVCNFDAYRIGFNDISRKCTIADNMQRKIRYQAVLQSLLSSFLNPKGAMTSTQKPHITDFKGVVSVSYKLIPAPTVSAINPDYLDEITKITENLNKIEPDSIELKPFNGLGDLSKVIVELMEDEPYKIE